MIGWSNMGAGQSFGFTITQYDENTDFSNLIGKENEIAVLSDVKISQWRCLGSLPSDPVADEIIIIVGENTNVAIPALKKQNITIYPEYVMQYVNNNWVNRISKIWLNSHWVDLDFTLYNNSFKIEDWEINTSVKFDDGNYYSYKYNYGGSGVALPDSYNCIYVAIGGSANWSSNFVGTQELVNKLNKTFLNFNLTWYSGGGAYNAWVMLASTKSDNLSGNTYIKQQITTTGITTIDISSIADPFYIFFCAGVDGNSHYTSISIDKIWLS